MSDATDFGAIPTVRREKTASLPLPAPVPFGAPVLISDCVSPLAGETVLSLIWRRLDRTDEKAPDP